MGIPCHIRRAQINTMLHATFTRTCLAQATWTSPPCDTVATVPVPCVAKTELSLFRVHHSDASSYLEPPIVNDTPHCLGAGISIFKTHRAVQRVACSPHRLPLAYLPLLLRHSLFTSPVDLPGYLYSRYRCNTTLLLAGSIMPACGNNRGRLDVSFRLRARFGRTTVAVNPFIAMRAMPTRATALGRRPCRHVGNYCMRARDRPRVIDMVSAYASPLVLPATCVRSTSAGGLAPAAPLQRWQCLPAPRPLPCWKGGIQQALSLLAQRHLPAACDLFCLQPFLTAVPATTVPVYPQTQQPFSGIPAAGMACRA